MRLARRAVIGLLLLSAVPTLGAQPQKAVLDITFKTNPSPAVTGKNAVEVTVKDAAGKPVVDADVSATFLMAAMPAMRMPEMKNTITLKHVKAGTYAGTGQVMMGGTWDVTVAVKRSGKEIGSKTFPVTAK